MLFQSRMAPSLLMQGEGVVMPLLYLWVAAYKSKNKDKE
tara:strand:+ start:119 stop:235 length:117 start_codon:yes stop_codon:yes gene_type:complete